MRNPIERSMMGIPGFRYLFRYPQPVPFHYYLESPRSVGRGAWYWYWYSTRAGHPTNQPSPIIFAYGIPGWYRNRRTGPIREKASPNPQSFITYSCCNVCTEQYSNLISSSSSSSFHNQHKTRERKVQRTYIHSNPSRIPRRSPNLQGSTFDFFAYLYTCPSPRHSPDASTG